MVKKTMVKKMYHATLLKNAVTEWYLCNFEEITHYIQDRIISALLKDRNRTSICFNNDYISDYEMYELGNSIYNLLRTRKTLQKYLEDQGYRISMESQPFINGKTINVIRVAWPEVYWGD